MSLFNNKEMRLGIHPLTIVQNEFYNSYFLCDNPNDILSPRNLAPLPISLDEFSI